jgi:hypothetical protein
VEHGRRQSARCCDGSEPPSGCARFAAYPRCWADAGVVKERTVTGEQRFRSSAILAAVLAAGAVGCALLPRTHDRVLGITCVVSDPTGQPVGGAEVGLALDRVAYHAVDPVREERQVTSQSGGVVFMFVTDVPSTPYVLTVRKAGYAAKRASGVAASGRAGTHVRITLVPSTADAEQR